MFRDFDTPHRQFTQPQHWHLRIPTRIAWTVMDGVAGSRRLSVSTRLVSPLGRRLDSDIDILLTPSDDYPGFVLDGWYIYGVLAFWLVDMNT